MNVASRDSRPSLHRHIYRTPQGAGPPSVTCIWQMKEGQGGVRLSVPTWIRETEAMEKNPPVNYCSGSLEAIHVSLTSNEVYLHSPAILEFL